MFPDAAGPIRAASSPMGGMPRAAPNAGGAPDFESGLTSSGSVQVVGSWKYELGRDAVAADAIAGAVLFGRSAGLTCTPGQWLDRFDERDRAEVERWWKNCLGGAIDEFAIEVRIRPDGGRGRWALLSARSVRDDSGRVTVIAGGVQDISQRRRLMALLLGQSRILERIAAGAPLNETLTHLVRMIQEQSEGMLGSVLILDDENRRLWTGAAPDLPEAYSKRINGIEIGPSVGTCGTAAWRRERVICEDIARDPLWADYRELALEHGLRACWSEPIRSERGEVVGTFAMYYREVRGPTEEDLAVISTAAHLAGIAIASKRAADAVLAARRALERAHARLEAIFDGAANIAIQCYDKDGRVVMWNAASERLYGFSRSEALGRRLGEFLLSEEDGRAFEELLAGVGATPPVLREFAAKTRSGETRHVLASLLRVPGRDVGMQWVCVDVDITERKRLEQQLLHSQKMEGIGRLAGGIAHDFNNLLTAIIGYTELTSAALPQESPVRPHLRQIQRAVGRASELTRHLLAFARRQVIEPQVVNLNALVQEMEKLLRRLIGEHVDLHVRTASDLWPVEVDPGQFEQILVNLAVNARDAMARGGRLTIETYNVPVIGAPIDRPETLSPVDHVCLSVRDSGVGMDEETLEHIFEPFFTTKPDGGTGLGLATAYGVVKQAGGEIVVESRPNAGAVFRIYLPRTERRPEPGGEPDVADRPSAARGETILLVEDEPLVRDLAEDALRAQGYHVLVAEHGDDALAVAAGYCNRIDLLLCDVVLPGAPSREVVARVRERHPDIRILFISGYTDDQAIMAGALESGSAILAKPFTPATLAARVREALQDR